MLELFLLGLFDRVVAVTGLGHSIISSIKQNNKDRELLAILTATNDEVKRLSDSVLYLPTVTEVRQIGDGLQSHVREMGELREALRPVQRALGGGIISTSAIITPPPLQSAFREDPRDVLFDIRPLTNLRTPEDSSLIPVLFEEYGEHYIGWQKRGILTLFGLEYSRSNFLDTLDTLDTLPPYAAIHYRDRRGPQRYLMVKDEIIVGREAPDVWVDLRLDTLPDISREHACIRRTPEGNFFLKNLSNLGTTIDGELIPSSLVWVGDGKWDMDRWVELPAEALIGLAGVVFLNFKVIF